MAARNSTQNYRKMSTARLQNLARRGGTESARANDEMIRRLTAGFTADLSRLIPSLCQEIVASLTTTNR